ncbi:unnamed protein product [marine sediment metagenome]|uniref:Uncharacterized protein n=1 Tax=marine sediment metagenome TaxID=412755 RepID=X1BLX5_9ZZZZ
MTKVELRKEQKEKYKEMDTEDIIKEVQMRNPNVMKQDIINASIWIKKQSKGS